MRTVPQLDAYQSVAWATARWPPLQRTEPLLVRPPSARRRNQQHRIRYPMLMGCNTDNFRPIQPPLACLGIARGNGPKLKSSTASTCPKQPAREPRRRRSGLRQLVEHRTLLARLNQSSAWPSELTQMSCQVGQRTALPTRAGAVTPVPVTLSRSWRPASSWQLAIRHSADHMAGEPFRFDWVGLHLQRPGCNTSLETVRQLLYRSRQYAFLAPTVSDLESPRCWARRGTRCGHLGDTSGPMPVARWNRKDRTWNSGSNSVLRSWSVYCSCSSSSVSP